MLSLEATIWGSLIDKYAGTLISADVYGDLTTAAKWVSAAPSQLMMAEVFPSIESTPPWVKNTHTQLLINPQVATGRSSGLSKSVRIKTCNDSFPGQSFKKHAVFVTLNSR